VVREHTDLTKKQLDGDNHKKLNAGDGFLTVAALFVESGA